MKATFTESATQALQDAAEEAGARHQRAVEPRHLLLALSRRKVGTVARLLRTLHVERESLLDAVTDSLPRRREDPPPEDPSELPYTRRAETVLDAAAREAGEADRSEIGVTDLLLALASERGISRTLLEGFGVTERALRPELGRERDQREAEPEAEQEPDEVGPRAAEAPPGGGRSIREDRGFQEPLAPEQSGALEESPTYGAPGAPERPRRSEESPTPEEPEGPDRDRLGETPRPTDAVPATDRPPADRSASPPGAESTAAPSPDQVRAPGQRRAPAEAPAADRAPVPDRAPTPGRPQTPDVASGPARKRPAPPGFLDLDPTDSLPLYRQIVEGIREAAATGRLAPGQRLPPVRALADAADLAPGTVARAYRELEREGVLETRGTRGTFLAGRGRDTPPAGERRARLVEILRPVAVSAFHLGAREEDLRAALEEAMDGILTEQRE